MAFDAYESPSETTIPPTVKCLPVSQMGQLMVPLKFCRIVGCENSVQWAGTVRDVSDVGHMGLLVAQPSSVLGQVPLIQPY